jgi:hypothetical protein
MSGPCRWIREMSRPSLVALATAGGALAGVVSWAVALVLNAAFGSGSPGALSLLLAVPRGALFGAILAWAVHAWCARRP